MQLHLVGFRHVWAGPAIDKYGDIDAAGSDNPMGLLGIPADTYVTGEDIALDGGKRLMAGNMNSH